MIKPDAGNSALFGKVGLAKARLRALVNCFFRGCKKIMRGQKKGNPFFARILLS